MSKAEKLGEPSMEEILASIRKIIAEEPAQPGPVPTAPTLGPPQSSPSLSGPSLSGMRPEPRLPARPATTPADAQPDLENIDDVLGLADEDEPPPQVQPAPQRPPYVAASVPSRSVPSWLFPRSSADALSKPPAPVSDPLSRPSGSAEIAPPSADASERPSASERPPVTSAPTAAEQASGSTPKSGETSKDLGSFVPGPRGQRRDGAMPAFDPPAAKPSSEPTFGPSPNFELSRLEPLPHELPSARPAPSEAPETSDPFAAPVRASPSAAATPAEKPVRNPASIFDRLSALGVGGSPQRPSSQPESPRARDREAPVADTTPSARLRREPEAASPEAATSATARAETFQRPLKTLPEPEHAIGDSAAEAPAQSAKLDTVPPTRTADAAIAKPVVTDAAPGLPVSTETTAPAPTARAISTIVTADTVAPRVEPAVRTLEDTVAELLRPMLREWLDANMPRIVEKALRVELASTVQGKNGSPKT